MTLKDFDDEDLLIARQNYAAKPGAKVEFNVHKHGVSIVANREGWQSLAEWCAIMAHPDMQDGLDPYSLTMDVVPPEMVNEERSMTAFWGITEPPDAMYQDVWFHRSEVIGDEYWEGAISSGNSPYSQAGAAEAVARYTWMDGKNRKQVEEQMGAPIFEAVYEGQFEKRKMSPQYGGDGGQIPEHMKVLANLPDVTGVAYKADTPAGWLMVRYNDFGAVQSFSFGLTPPWDPSAEQGRVVIPYEGE